MESRAFQPPTQAGILIERDVAFLAAIYMRPSIALGNVADDVSAHTKVFGYIALAIPSSQKVLDLDYLLINQFRHWTRVRRTFRAITTPTLCYFVSYIRRIVPKEQMVNIYT